MRNSYVNNRCVLMLSCLAVTLVAQGCGRVRDDERVLTKNAELYQYMVRFEKEIGWDTSDIEADFGIDDKNIYGICYMWTDGSKQVKVNAVEWAKLDDAGRENLMYHELGHCAMNLDHDNRGVVDPEGFSISGSVMNKYFFGDAWPYRKYRNGYKSALREVRLISDFN